MCHSDMGRKGGVSSPNGINLAEVNWGAYDLVVIDESHRIRNPNSQQGMVCRQMAAAASFTIYMNAIDGGIRIAVDPAAAIRPAENSRG